MATSDENDEPVPMAKTYSPRISVEEHEALVVSETEKHLNLLLNHLQENPAVFSEYLKQRYIKEMEDGGLFSNLKMKFLSLFFGQNFLDINQETRDNKWKEFEATTINAYNTSQRKYSIFRVKDFVYKYIFILFIHFRNIHLMFYVGLQFRLQTD